MAKLVKSKIITTFEALEKARNYCAYSERSQYDVRVKLQEWSIDQVSSESIISTLVEENFLNEERFAKAFAHGKLRINHWGRVKIKMALRQHQVSDRCIKNALNELDEDEYQQIIIKEAKKKIDLLTGSKAILHKKTVTFLIGKGFESDLCYQIVINQINQLK
jgi:regulatory protein